MRRRAPLLVVAALLSIGGACSPAAAPAVATDATRLSATPVAIATRPVSTGVAIVEAAEQYFNPDQITVNVGTTVVWNDVQGTHDMVADDKSFASAVLFEGGSYAHLFTMPGHYRYVCTLHVGAGMWAEVDVQ